MAEAIDLEHTGSVADALEAYRAAIAEGERLLDRRTQAEALRRLAVQNHHRGERQTARELCERSYAIATEIGDDVLAGEALNALANFDLESGALEEARTRYLEALALGGASPQLRGRVEQNLGILANIRGDHHNALLHYRRSLDGVRELRRGQGLRRSPITISA